MLNIQTIFDIIETYRCNKGRLKKIFCIDHPAISATKTYLKRLKNNSKFDALNIQDLLIINGFFCNYFSSKLKRVVFDAWISINYQYFFQIKSKNAISTMRIPNDKQNELYYCGIKQLILKKQLTENNFINLSYLWIEEILNPDHFEAILNNAHSYFLVKALIDLKRGNSLTSENTSFICSYKTLLSCPLASILVYMEQMDLNTFKNRERLRHSHDRLIPLLYAIELLVKAESLTQENFELIQAKEKITWLYALWNMPIDLINADVWQGLINLSVTSKENEFNKDINTYAKSLRSKKIKRNETVEKGSKLKINKLYSDFFSYSEESVMLTDPVETRVSLLRS